MQTESKSTLRPEWTPQWPGALLRLAATDQHHRQLRPILVMLLLCCPTTLQTVHAAAVGDVQVGQTLPDATMRGLNGPARNLAEFRGKRLIINVWASWCGPCRAEMASLERLAWRDDADFNIIGISTDDYPDRARAFLQASNATISHFIDFQLHLERMLGASRLPLTLLVDADGKVKAKVYGAKQWDGPQALKLISEAFVLRH